MGGRSQQRLLLLKSLLESPRPSSAQCKVLRGRLGISRCSCLGGPWRQNPKAAAAAAADTPLPRRAEALSSFPPATGQAGSRAISSALSLEHPPGHQHFSEEDREQTK